MVGMMFFDICFSTPKSTRLQKKLALADAATDRTLTRHSEALKECEELEEQVDSLHRQEKSLRGDIKHLNDSLEKSDNEKNAVHEDWTKTSGNLAAAQTEIYQRDALIEQQREQLSRQQESLRNYVVMVEAKDLEIRDKDYAIGDLQNRLRHADDEIEHLKTQIKRMKAPVATYEDFNSDEPPMTGMAATVAPVAKVVNRALRFKESND